MSATSESGEEHERRYLSPRRAHHMEGESAGELVGVFWSSPYRFL